MISPQMKRRWVFRFDRGEIQENLSVITARGVDDESPGALAVMSIRLYCYDTLLEICMTYLVVRQKGAVVSMFCSPCA